MTKKTMTNSDGTVWIGTLARHVCSYCSTVSHGGHSALRRLRGSHSTTGTIPYPDMRRLTPDLNHSTHRPVHYAHAQKVNQTLGRMHWCDFQYLGINFHKQEICE